MKRTAVSLSVGLIMVTVIAFAGCGSDEETDARGTTDGPEVTPADMVPVKTKAAAKKVPRRPQPCDVITNSIGMKLVYIPPTGPNGFLMGSPATEDKRGDDERQHRVILTKGFWMGATEVTQSQWRAVMKNNPSKDDDLTVEKVSWNDAVEFCRKLSRREGKNYRLPTEAEWEYACRAGTTTPFNTGQTISTDQANYNGNYTYGSGRKGVYRKKTTPVGNFAPNAWGLYDMHGNVYEWCSDWYEKDYPRGTATDPSGPKTGALRVLRGGSWLYFPGYCRSASRRWHTPDYRDFNLGFRVALDSE